MVVRVNAPGPFAAIVSIELVSSWTACSAASKRLLPSTIASNMLVNACDVSCVIRRASSIAVRTRFTSAIAADTAMPAAAKASIHGPPRALTTLPTPDFSPLTAGVAPTRIAAPNPFAALSAPIKAFCMLRISGECDPMVFIAAPVMPICGASLWKS